MKKRNVLSNDSGVSEVIGTILLLSISVTLFSVVYVTVLSFPGAPSTPSSNIAFSLNDTSLTLTHVGGKPLSLNSKIQIIVDNIVHTYDVTTGLNAAETQDNFWGFGEQFKLTLSEIGITPSLINYTLNVAVIDVDSNSVVMSGTKVISNKAPIIGSPIPFNTSIDVPVHISQLKIRISDPDNDVFDWTIETSPNIGKHSGTNENSGIKTCDVSGLLKNTTYMWYVNATDSTKSGQYIRRCYSFTTERNHPPMYNVPSPANGSIGNSLSLSWSIPINDPEGNVFSWTIKCSNGQGISGTNALNGTKSLTLSNLDYLKTYTVWVNTTDPAPAGSGLYHRSWYTFTTLENRPPEYGIPSIANNSIGHLSSVTWSIPINDPEGNVFSWSIECSNSQNSSSSAHNGTKSLSLVGLSYSTSYKVWVNATDPTLTGGGGLSTTKWYIFTTNQKPIFDSPSPFNGSATNPTSLTWSININDPNGDTFTWSIQCSNGQSSSGTGASNGMKTVSLSGLTYSKTYTVWVNATDPGGSGLYTRHWYTFKTNSPPVFGAPSVGNNSGGNPSKNLNWGIPINDPEGNTFTWSIQCSNGQSSSGTGASNGTKFLVLTLQNNRQYKVWVNATDPSGSGLYTRRWYLFNT